MNLNTGSDADFCARSGFMWPWGNLQPSFQEKTEDGGWYQHGDKRWNQQRADDSESRDVAFYPKHDGGDVSDGRECSAAVGAEDDHGCIKQLVLSV